jgi:hypothetical protein
MNEKKGLIPGFPSINILSRCSFDFTVMHGLINYTDNIDTKEKWCHLK